MRALVIGGTGFIGPHAVRGLTSLGHQVVVYHRGRSGSVPAGAAQMIGDRKNLADHRNEFRRFAPDVVIDCILSSGAQAAKLMETFRGIAGRVVALSSADVYRACGVLHGLESGPLQAVPLTEVSELRTCLHPYPPAALKMLQSKFGWLDDEYDKIPVERAVMSHPDLPATALRLPMVYGPGDPLHRFFPALKRIQDDRPAMLLEESAARWRGPRGYVANVGAAIALASTALQAQGRIYNIAERDAIPEMEWTALIARAAGWKGSLIAVRHDRAPAHLHPPGNYEQHWVVSSARIRDELGFQEPIAREEAFRRTVAWELDNPPEIDPKQFDYSAEDAALADTDAHLRTLSLRSAHESYLPSA